MAAYEQIEIAGHTVTITPIPALPMLRLTRRIAAALAAQKLLASTATTIAKTATPSSGSLSADETSFWLGFVEQVVVAIDGALLDDFLTEAGKVVVINNIRGKDVFSLFDGNMLGLISVLYHVLRISGFSHTLLEKS
jgi:hypothetical protein